MPTHPRQPIDVRDWAKLHGKAVTRGELLGILAMEERRRKAAAERRWHRRVLRWLRGIPTRLRAT